MAAAFISDELRDFLDRKVLQFNQPFFVNDDPLSVPHMFSQKQDQEIAGFFAATFAWGNRKTIINKCVELMKLMDNAPYQFMLHHSDKDLKGLLHFKHRTFNSTDLLYFVEWMHHHYRSHDTLEKAFFPAKDNGSNAIEVALDHFYESFFSLEDAPLRTRKHIASRQRNSSCKRLNMFLRWMVRKDDQRVDLGIWKSVQPSQLICPVDVHVARVAKSFGLLNRKQVDWQAAVELTEVLRSLDPVDPVKYDFALFGLGILERY